MNDLMRAILEMTVVIPGLLLAYLPMKAYLKVRPAKLFAGLAPLMIGLCVAGGVCCWLFKDSYHFCAAYCGFNCCLDLRSNAACFYLEIGAIYFLPYVPCGFASIEFLVPLMVRCKRKQLVFLYAGSDY